MTQMTSSGSCFRKLYQVHVDVAAFRICHFLIQLSFHYRGRRRSRHQVIHSQSCSRSWFQYVVSLSDSLSRILSDVLFVSLDDCRCNSCWSYEFNKQLECSGCGDRIHQFCAHPAGIQDMGEETDWYCNGCRPNQEDGYVVDKYILQYEGLCDGGRCQLCGFRSLFKGNPMLTCESCGRYWHLGCKSIDGISWLQSGFDIFSITLPDFKMPVCFHCDNVLVRFQGTCLNEQGQSRSNQNDVDIVDLVESSEDEYESAQEIEETSPVYHMEEQLYTPVSPLHAPESSGYNFEWLDEQSVWCCTDIL